MGSRIVATGRAVPRTVLPNRELEKLMNTSDEWIRTRTGIAQRFVIGWQESLVEIAAQASLKALQRAAIKPAALDAIVAGTVSSDYAFPSFACQLQRRLGADMIPAFDVAAACSGFVYALSVADAAMRCGDWRKILVVGADALSTMVDWTDRSTAVLFGDGAGAAVLAFESGSRGILATLLRSSGSYADLLSVAARGVRTTMDAELRRSPEEAVKMRGAEVFKLAVKSMEEVTRHVVEQAGFRLEDITLIVPHQANLRIINAVAERLGLDHDRVFVNIERYGNTSAASIPIALDEAVEVGRIRDNDLVLLNACGGGLTWAASLVRW